MTSPGEIAPANGEPDRLLRLSEVMVIVGYGRSMIYRLIKHGAFPRQYKPGGDSSRWSAREIQAWIEEVKAAREDRG